MDSLMLTQSQTDDLKQLVAYLSDGIAAAETKGETKVNFIVSLTSETRQRIARLSKVLTER